MTTSKIDDDSDVRLVVARDDKTRCQLVRGPTTTLADGEVLLRVERFGMTSNNVTYAALSVTMPYLDFFDAPSSDGWGVLPVWGIGRVEASRHAGVPVGVRVFGFFPAARWVVLAPTAVKDAGFRVERPGIPPEYALYSQYQRTDVDPFHLRDYEDAMVVFRPLFLTGIALADYLSSKTFEDIQTIIISSASSKTAYGLASALRALGARRPIVGLSSPANTPFVDSLGVYDQVDSYDAVNAIATAQSAVHVDIAGSRSVRAAIHERLGAGLRLTLSVGMTHGEAGGYSRAIEGPATEVFFAPGWMARRRGELGEAFLPAMLEGWRAQMKGVEQHFAIRRRHGPESMRDTYRELARGGARASDAYVVDASHGDLRDPS
jgi:NADPH:quinone reductase-like Zn-dependent oxidoreductase